MQKMNYFCKLMCDIKTYLWYRKCMRRERRRRSRLAVAFNLTVDYQHLKIKGQIMALTFNTTQFVISTLQPVDAAGATASYQKGTVSFSTTDPNIFTVLQDTTNELSATLTAIAVGTATLNYQGTNLAGSILTGTVDVTVVAVPLNDATQFLITFGTPQEQASTTTTSTTTL